MPRLELSGLNALNFSDTGKVRFTAQDRIRGEVEVTIVSPEDAYQLAEFLAQALSVWAAGGRPEDAGYLRLAG